MASARLQPGDIIALYRAVLRCHAQRLPPPLRSMGDSYARDEFRRHHKANPPATAKQWEQFALEWAKYVEMMEGRGDLNSASPSGSLDDSMLRHMSEEQLQRLDMLKQEAEKLGGKP